MVTTVSNDYSSLLCYIQALLCLRVQNVIKNKLILITPLTVQIFHFVYIVLTLKTVPKIEHTKGCSLVLFLFHPSDC